ncbi:flagellar basal body-associated FliL family protein [Pararhizobium haloflavum]|uniref:flagellar basal body-associated FliL family protein n=1 Tax=Pararhizobium haloflavum TaxID=2037914 RepID=UPI000C1A4676|nr:flagellar basal body-associated FliL family protein [Pararhizobium haloflavum]
MTTPEDGKAKGPSMIVTLAVVAVLSLVAAGGGWMMGGLLAPTAEAVQTAAREGATGHGETAEAEGAGAEGEPADAIIDLAAITTNLAYPAENWIRLEVSLLFDGAGDEAMARVIQEDMLAYLRTVSLQQIEGPRGFQHLREDLSERASLRSEGRVTDLLFKTFVIE